MTTDNIHGNDSRFRHAYAIVRIDEFQGPSVPFDRKVTIKKIVWSLERATAEVDRLNTINAGNQCHYFWQLTRLEDETADILPEAFAGEPKIGDLLP